MLVDLGKIKWDSAQARELGEKLKDAIGLPETWRSANLNEAKTILKGLLVSELEKLKNTELALSLRNLKDADWRIDQVYTQDLLPFSIVSCAIINVVCLCICLDVHLFFFRILPMFKRSFSL